MTEADAAHDQSRFDIRFEWGERGAQILAPMCDAIIIVDVMSFSSAVTVAVGRDAVVYPYRHRDASSASFAESRNAILAGSRGAAAYSLSPVSLASLDPGSHIVLPSPNLGYPEDVAMIAELNCETAVPRLIEGAYVRAD